MTCGGVPSDRPVDREQFSDVSHRLYHEVSIYQAAGKASSLKNRVIMVEIYSCNLPFSCRFLSGGLLPPDSRERLLYNEWPQICDRLLRSVLRRHYRILMFVGHDVVVAC